MQLERHLDANVAAGLRTRRFCVLVRLLQNAGLIVTVEGGDIIVALPKSGFRAVYYKPADQPQLILRSRTAHDNYELLARAGQAANTTARELGWIV